MAEILENTSSVKEHSLNKLQQWLQYGKHSWSLGAGIVWLPPGMILMGLKIIMYAFTPYMLWYLYKAKWHKSIIVFLAVVVQPFLFSEFMEFENHILGFLLSILPFLTFYIYTYILSYMIGEQLNEIQTVRKWHREELMNN